MIEEHSIACVHCNLNKINHKEVFFYLLKKALSNMTIILGQREYNPINLNMCNSKRDGNELSFLW